MKLFDIQKYIRKNPSAGCELIRSCDGFFTFAVVVPMLNENDNAESFFSNLLQAITTAEDEKILVAAVVNCHKNSPEEYKKDNFLLLERLRKNEFKIPNLAIFDHTSDGKTLKNGVGEARKIGMDHVLNLFDFKDFENSVICSLDADTIISNDYFSRIRQGMNQNKSCGALTFNVKHQLDAINPEAIKQYEEYMQSYRTGLEYANSPYAFFTVGSAFAVRASAYIYAGGMRKLKAGEDFYFLQSAVKSSGVKHFPQVTVQPSARFSPRVPFGTGTALQAITENAKEFIPFPQFAFEALKNVISAAEEDKLISPQKYLESISPESRAFFKQHNFETDWQKVTGNMPQKQLPSAFLLHWFDGLKTLQFLKYMVSKYC
ncbi:MAG: hypothetical protein IKB71_10735 [Lentisphaeria bacterium]|nr:hypothetical protein [Lentisphaeria bacterium]